MAIENFVTSSGIFSCETPYDKDAIGFILKSSRQYRRTSPPCSGRVNPDSGAEFCQIRSPEIAGAGDLYPNKVPAEKPPLGIII